MRKIILITITVFLPQFALADVDSYKFCQAYMDAIKRHSLLDLDYLLNTRRVISNAENVSELSLATGKPFGESTALLMKEGSMSKEDAEKYVMTKIKYNEIQLLNFAIEFHGVKDERVFTNWYRRCLVDYAKQ